MLLLSKTDHIIENGLLVNSEELSQSAIAKFIREVIFRWGLANKRQLLQHVRKQLKIAGIENTVKVSKVLNHLISLGELEEVLMDYETFIAPCYSSWIKSGNNEGTIIGSMFKSTNLQYLENSYDNDILRRFSITSDEDLTNLYLDGINETTLEEWLKPILYPT